MVTMYQTVRAALIKRNGSVTDAQVRAVMGEIDAARYAARNKRRMGRPASRSGVTILQNPNRRQPHQREQLPAGKGSGSFGATKTHPWLGGWRGAAAGAVVTNRSGPLPAPPPIRAPRARRGRRGR